MAVEVVLMLSAITGDQDLWVPFASLTMAAVQSMAGQSIGLTLAALEFPEPGMQLLAEAIHTPQPELVGIQLFNQVKPLNLDSRAHIPVQQKFQL